MSKRFLLLVCALIAGAGLAGLFLHWYNEREISIPASSEEELAKSYRQLSPYASNAPTAPSVAPTPLLPASQHVRLAIGALGGPDDTQNARLADLLTAELSGAEGLELVERNALDKVLRELELSRSGLVRAKDAVRAGKLLHADWFLLGSKHEVGSTNILVARAVDARTGILRGVTVLGGGESLTRSASELGAFVRECRRAASSTVTRPRVLLGVGAFADVGINGRQAAFPDQLRSYLTMGFRNSNVTLLERESINALVEEVRLDLAGLADQSTGPIPPLQSAFWLVDGWFQSYEASGFEVEVAIRVTRIFGRSTTCNLRGPPDQALFRRIKEAVDAAIAQGRSRPLLMPTRMSESRMQLQIARDLMHVISGGNPNFEFLLPSPSDTPITPQRRFNVEEAMRALQTVLLLDPTNREAKFHMGRCLSDPSVGRGDEARNYLVELTNSTARDKWRSAAATFLSVYDARGEEEAGTPKAMEASVNRLLGEVGGYANIIRGKSGGFLYEDLGFGWLVRSYGTNVQAAADKLTELLPTLRQKYPDMEPYLLSNAAAHQVDTNTPVVGEFRKSLAVCREHPEKIVNSPFYFESVLGEPYEWCMKKKAFSLAAELAEAKRDVALKTTNVVFNAPDHIKLAYAYMAQQRWADALSNLDQISDQAISMGSEGPWGSGYYLALPGKLAGECRAKMGLPPHQRADRFDFGKPCLRLSAPFAFGGSENALWLAFPGSLCQLNLDLSTNLEVRLPSEAAYAPITVLALGPSQVWLGTEGAGLIEYDTATRQCRRWTQKDGLLLDDISCLSLENKSLWIGFGQGWGNGGLGKLDLTTGRLSAFTPSLSPASGDSTKAYSSLHGPQAPRVGLWNVSAIPDQVWMASSEGIRMFSPPSGDWRAFSPPGYLRALSVSAEPGRVLMGFAVWGIPPQVAQVEEQRPGTGTNLPVTAKLLVNAAEWDRLKADPARKGRVNGVMLNWAGGNGVVQFSPKQAEWQLLVEPGSLPGQLDLLVPDGQDVWLAGPGYVAVFDRTRSVLRRFCPIAAPQVDSLQVFGGYVWVKFGRSLYRAPLSATR